ncbi:MAG: S8 family peptidase [Elusimicrobia bacterium]|nr:S8 family peptidase [Elusimicrobiota bacterium]
MRWLVAVVLGLAPWAAGPRAAAEEPLGTAASRRIVVFNEAVSPAARLAIASQSGGSVVRELRLINAVVVRAPKALLQSVESKLKARSEVLRIDDDPRVNWLGALPSSVAEVPWPAMDDFLKGGMKPFRSPKAADPAPSAGQDTPWGIARVNAPAAWAVTKGKGVKVAVVDTGIDFDHPDLKANIAGGWSAVDTENPQNYKDDNGHGTHVAGTIAALDDAAGVVGVAPETTLYAVKVLDKNGSGNFSDVIAGMEWTVTNKMVVVNMSLGASKGNEALQAAVEAMAKAGVTLVAAAGNNGGAVGYPASYPQAIAISASGPEDKVAYFSSRGPQIAFIGPGVSIQSTSMGGGYRALSGTSMSCPHVAGLAALAVAARGVNDPDGLRAVLRAAATPIPGVPVEEQGAGVIDAAKVVR